METARTAGPYRPRHPELTVLHRVAEALARALDLRLAM